MSSTTTITENMNIESLEYIDGEEEEENLIALYQWIKRFSYLPPLIDAPGDGTVMEEEDEEAEYDIPLILKWLEKETVSHGLLKVAHEIRRNCGHENDSIAEPSTFSIWDQICVCIESISNVVPFDGSFQTMKRDKLSVLRALVCIAVSSECSERVKYINWILEMRHDELKQSLMQTIQEGLDPLSNKTNTEEEGEDEEDDEEEERVEKHRVGKRDRETDPSDVPSPIRKCRSIEEDSDTENSSPNLRFSEAGYDNETPLKSNVKSNKFQTQSRGVVERTAGNNGATSNVEQPIPYSDSLLSDEGDTPYFLDSYSLSLTTDDDSDDEDIAYGKYNHNKRNQKHHNKPGSPFGNSSNQLRPHPRTNKTTMNAHNGVHDDDGVRLQELLQAEKRQKELEEENTLLKKSLEKAKENEEEATRTLSEIQSKQISEDLKRENEAISRENQMQKKFQDEIQNLQMLIEARRGQEEELRKAFGQINELQSELKGLRGCKEKLTSVEEQLRLSKRKVNDLEYLQDSLKFEEESRQEYEKKCAVLEKELDTLRPLQKQVDLYIRKSNDASLKLVDMEHELNSEKERNGQLNEKVLAQEDQIKRHMMEINHLKGTTNGNGGGLGGTGDGANGDGEDGSNFRSIADETSVVEGEMNSEQMMAAEMQRLRKENIRLKAVQGYCSEESVQKLETRNEELLTTTENLSNQLLQEQHQHQQTLKDLETTKSHNMKLKEDVTVLKKEGTKLFKKLQNQARENSGKIKITKNEHKEIVEKVTRKAREDLRKLETSMRSILEDELSETRKQHLEEITRLKRNFEEKEKFLMDEQAYIAKINKDKKKYQDMARAKIAQYKSKLQDSMQKQVELQQQLESMRDLDDTTAYYEQQQQHVQEEQVILDEEHDSPTTPRSMNEEELRDQPSDGDEQGGKILVDDQHSTNHNYQTPSSPLVETSSFTFSSSLPSGKKNNNTIIGPNDLVECRMDGYDVTNERE